MSNDFSRLWEVTLDFELDATLSVFELQILIGEPGTLEGRYNYVIAAVDPQSMHCSKMGILPAPSPSAMADDRLPQEHTHFYDDSQTVPSVCAIAGAASLSEREASA